MVSRKYVFWVFLICAGIQGLQAFGDQQPTNSGRQSDKMPVHSKPKEKTEKFIADITDERSVIRVQWLTFSGDQKIGGLRKENDDSSNALDLENIKQIEVKERFHEVKRYPNMIFALVEVTFKSGVKDTYLFPQDIVICAEEIDPKCPKGPTECPKGEKAWHLNTINKIELLDDPSKPLATVPVVEKKETESCPSRPQEESMSKTVTTTQALEDFQEKKQDYVLEKKEYKEMELKVVEKNGQKFEEKTVMGTAKDVVKAVIVFIKAIFEAVKRWIW